MNLHVAYPTSLLEHLTSTACQGCDGLVLAHGHPDRVFASIVEGNPLSAGWLAPMDLPGNHVMTWSGTLADELFASHPATWSGQGRDALDRFCDGARAALIASGRRLLLRPHARHVLSDTPSTMAFLDDHAADPVGIVLAPADLLEPSMLGELSDHLERFFTLLGHRADAVLLEDITLGENGLATCPLGEGEIDQGNLLAMVGELDASIPVIITAKSVAAQLQWLDRDGNRSTV